MLKRSEISNKKNIIFRVSSVILALLTTSIFLIILNQNPFNVYLAMLSGAFGTVYRIRETLIKSIPLIIASLGISVAFRMKFWNIGGEGQILMGAFMASIFALKFPNLPSYILLPIMIIAGIVGGGVWALIPSFFKAKWNTNETIVTLMMNYIALKWIMYLQYGPWRDKNAMGFPKIPNFSDNGILPSIFQINIGIIFALILTVVIHLFINNTKKGYEIVVLGESEKTAIYAGINVNKTIIIAMFVSGGLCGLTGMIQASAVSNTLSMEVAGGAGYSAIIVAWLSNLSAPIILFVSIMFAGLLEGGSYIQVAFQIPQSVALILQSVILFFVLGSEFFIKYRLSFTKKETKI